MILFFITVFLLPLNLAKHFIFSWSYVNGLLVDYLVPAIFVLELLMLTTLFFWIPRVNWRAFLHKHIAILRILVLFVTSVCLSLFFATNIYAAVYAFVKLLFYLGFFLYVLDTFIFDVHFEPITKFLSISILLLSLLAFYQWYNQGSAFNNYLFFGEQPYTFSTPSVAKESVFGVTKIPAYGTFRHPNIFGGFLSISLLWLIFKARNPIKKPAVTFGIGALILTFSQTAWLSFLFGVSAFVLYTKRWGRICSLCVAFVIVCSALFIPFFSDLRVFEHVPSIFRRSHLEVASLQAVSDFPLFGVGLNNNVVVLESYLSPTAIFDSALRFPQPVHNIFLVVLVETGVFALAFFSLLLIYALYRTYKTNSLLFISILQLLILGSFDHYLLTIEQTRLLFWLTLGIALAYNHNNEK